uniref:C2H2-type domain-containing protein n=1 Tax=Gouania willdenowi TaxID=441366 RepID=A0A8C5EGL7_GOUWI
MLSGTEKLTCSQYGCKRIYNDPEALEQHLQEHQIPAQSVPAKVLLCSSIGCSSSFPNMQKLMEHVRCHHKLNVFFQCESCRTKLRSYRGLLTHLHSCSKVGRGRPKAAEAPASTAPTLKEQPPAQLEVTSNIRTQYYCEDMRASDFLFLNFPQFHLRGYTFLMFLFPRFSLLNYLKSTKHSKYS